MIRWTDDMLKALRELRAKRIPLLECAEKIGVSYPTAVFKARELGLAQRMNRGRRPGRALIFAAALAAALAPAANAHDRHHGNPYRLPPVAGHHRHRPPPPVYQHPYQPHYHPHHPMPHYRPPPVPFYVPHPPVYEPPRPFYVPPPYGYRAW